MHKEDAQKREERKHASERKPDLACQGGDHQGYGEAEDPRAGPAHGHGLDLDSGRIQLGDDDGGDWAPRHAEDGDEETREHDEENRHVEVHLAEGAHGGECRHQQR